MKKRILSLLLVLLILLPMFSITTVAASEPTITSHKNGQSYAPDDFYIKWKAVSGAKRYRLAVKSLDDGSYAADIWWDDKLTKNRYECDEDDIKPGHRYKIWVAACGTGHEDVLSQASIEVTAKAVEKDTTVPLINPIKSSAGSSFVEGTNTTFSTRASDNKELHRVYMYIDGKQVKKTSFDTIEYSTDSLSVGKHTIEVIAEDASGNENDTSIEVTVTAIPVEKDKSVPLINPITSSAGDSFTEGTNTTFSTRASDNALYKIYMYIDGTEVKTTSSDTIEYSTNSLSVGKHTIEVIAEDESGNENDTSIEVTVQNAVCPHNKKKEVYVDAAYAQITGNENYHNKTEYYDIICSDCNENIQLYVAKNKTKEAHSFSDNQCTECEYIKNEEVVNPIVLETPDVSVSTITVKVDEKIKISWNKVPNADFYTIQSWTDEKTYDDIKTTSFNKISFKKEGTYAISVYARSNNKAYKQSEPYTFNVTVQKGVCPHNKTHKIYIDTEQTPIADDEKYHSKTEYYHIVCSTCNETIQFNVADKSEKEKHSFSGNRCTECGYDKICDHTNSQDIYVNTKYTPIDGDDTYHAATHYYNRICKNCDETIEKNLEGSSEKEEHVFYGQECGRCRYTLHDNGNKNTILLGVGESKGYLNDTVISVQNNKGASVIPYIENGRTLIPLRFVSETLGAQVDWDGSTQKITITYGNTTAYYWIGKKTFKVNGRTIEDLAAPKINDGNTFVPIRKLCEEVFGMQVHYVEASSTIVIWPMGENQQSDSYYTNKMTKVHTHRYKSNKNGTHSCVKKCSGTTKSCSGNPCSVCGYSKPTQNKTTQTNSTSQYYEVEQLIVQGVLPFNDYEEPIYNVVYKQKNDLAETWKAFARRSWSEKMQLTLQVLAGKSNGNNDVYGEKMYEKILLEILAQATGNLEQMTQEQTTQMLLEVNQKGTKVDKELIKKATKRLGDSSKLAKPIKLVDSACSEIGNIMKYGNYALVLYQCFAYEYEKNAQYLFLMNEFVSLTGNDTLKSAMSNVIDDFVKKSEDQFYEFKKQVPNLVVDISKDILNLAKIIPQKVSPLIVFDVADFAKGALYAFTDIDEKLEASECLGFAHIISMSFSNGFYEKGRTLRKDGFDDKDNEYMRSAFELCRASAYLNYKYLSTEYTDTANQKWINEAKNNILGRSIKSYLK